MISGVTTSIFLPWVRTGRGKFDYLSAYCKVVYLDRTEGISSSEIRSHQRELRLGMVGMPEDLLKFHKESSFVNGVKTAGICTEGPAEELPEAFRGLPCVTQSYQELLEQSDALYILSHPSRHYEQVRAALEAGRHVALRGACRPYGKAVPGAFRACP